MTTDYIFSDGIPLPPDPLEYLNGHGVADNEPTTWEPVDLGPYLRGEIKQPQPSIGLHRSDGLRLIYPGREHAVLGETESGKTWFALACVAAELSVGNHVVYIHYEEGDPASTIERLRLLGVDPAVIAARLRFIAPAKAALTEWIGALLHPAPALVVHDGVNEAMSLIGADIMAADGAAAFRRRLVTPFLRVGAASIACDHLPKDRDGRGRDAYGSVHKGNALDGARIVLENIEPFGRRMRGVSYVFVTKDRPGQLRAHGRAPRNCQARPIIGTLVVDDATRPRLRDAVLRAEGRRRTTGPTPASARYGAEVAGDVYDVIAALPEHTVPSMGLLYAEMRKAGHPARHIDIRAAVADLTVEQPPRLIEVTGKRNAKHLRAALTVPSRGDV